MKNAAVKKQKAPAGIAGSTVRLPSGMTAYRALPQAKGKRPAMILLHERYGVVQHTKDLIVKFAKAGYVDQRGESSEEYGAQLSPFAYELLDAKGKLESVHDR